MKLSTDHSFHIGEQHLRQGKPCQDYALSGSLGRETAYAIVSDGCSSGGMTDIGSRLVALATLRSLEEGVLFDMYHDLVNAPSRNAYLESYRTSLKLETADLLATSMWAVVNERSAAVHVTGDGVVALEYEHALCVTTLSWNNNQPYYPAYRLGKLDQQFQMAQALAQEPFTRTDDIINTDNTVTSKSGSFIVERGMEGMRVYGALEHPEYGKLRTVALFSDGVEQIDQVETIPAIKALLSFKSVSGQFAVRRMNRFMQDAKKRGRGPIDDIAYAVIHLDNEEADHASDQTTDESNA